MAQAYDNTGLPFDNKRGSFTRILDLLSVGTYMQAGLTRGLIRDNDISIVDGVGGALRAANPFGSGYERGRHTNTQVLDDLGWQPETTGGKVARGTVGFLGDVFLDPTTYLTGGLSGLIKGTGKAGVKASHGVKAVSGLTPDVAKGIITKQSVKRGLKLTSSDVLKEADTFVKKYNDIVGLRGVARDLRWSLAGAPFGTKIFGKNADKIGFTLMRGEVLQKMGDASIAPAYGAVRNAVYGGKLGKLFSTKSSLYKLSKTDPGAMWDTFKANEIVRGFSANRRVALKHLHERAKIFEDLTSDEITEFISLMEDPSKWSRVQRLVKLNDTQEAIAWRNTLEELHIKTKAQVDNLLESKKLIKQKRNVTDVNLESARRELEEFDSKYREQLTEIRVKRINDKKALEDTINLLEDELNRIRVESGKVSEPIQLEDVIRKIEEFKVSFDEANIFRKKQETWSRAQKPTITNKLVNPDGTKRLASTAKDGSISVRGGVTPDEFISYIKGDIPGSTSAQKKAVFDRLAAEGFDEVWIRKNFNTSEKIQEFLIHHEQSHVLYDDISRYWEKGRDLLTPDKLDMEYRATLEAFMNVDDIRHLESFLPKPEGLKATLHKRILNQIKEKGYITYKTKESANSFRQYYPNWQVEMIDYGNFRITPPKNVIHKYQEQRSMLDAMRKNFDVVKMNLHDKSPTFDKVGTIEAISEYAFGRPDAISHSVGQEHLDNLIDLIRKESNPRSAIEWYVENNAHHFSGWSREVYPWVAEQIGYGRGKPYATWKELWETRYTEVLGSRGTETFDDVASAIKENSAVQIKKSVDGFNIELDKAKEAFEAAKKELDNKYWKRKTSKRYFADTFDYADDLKKLEKDYAKQVSNIEANKVKIKRKFSHQEQMKRFAEFRQMEMKRSAMLNKFKKAYTLDEIAAIKREIIDAGNVEVPYSVGFFTDELRADFVRSDFGEIGMYGRPVEDKTRVLDLISNDDKVKIVEDLKLHLHHRFNIDPEKITPYLTKRIGLMEYEIPLLLKNYFNLPYQRLSGDVYSGQKKLLYDLAYQDSFTRAQKGLLNSDMGKKAMEIKASQHAEIIKKFNMEEFSLKVKEGLEVHFLQDKRAKAGIIESIERSSDGKVVSVKAKWRDKVVDVRLDEIVDVKSSAKINTVDDYIRISGETDNFVTRQDELVKLIDDAREGLKEADKAHKRAYGKLYRSFKKRTADVRVRIKDLEDNLETFNNVLRGGEDYSELHKIDDLIERANKLEDALSSEDAFETMVRANYTDNVVDSAIKRASPDVADIVLNPDVEISEKVRSLAQILRNDLVEMGMSEVNIGKLKLDQFTNQIMSYLPHHVTDAGRKVFGTTDDIIKKFPAWGDDLGFGMVFNPYGVSRAIKRIPSGFDDLGNATGWINNPNVRQINEFFQSQYGDILKGKNVFSEDVAQIYLARATKNLDLLYDNDYMNNMMNVFGNEYKGFVQDGYKSVMNFGNLREVSSNVAKLELSLDISDDITAHLSKRGFIDRIKMQAIESVGMSDSYAYKKRFSELINAEINRFVKSNYPDTVRNQLYKDNLNYFKSSTELGNSLDDLAVPMVELNNSQIKKISSQYDNIKSRYLDNIRSSLLKFEEARYVELGRDGVPWRVSDSIRKGDTAFLRKHINELFPDLDDIDASRLELLINKIDTFDGLSNVNVRQVNNAIVDKANQARKLQIAKDQSRFLRTYDKLTHFIKLNQTTIIPAFHARNKMSNTFNSALEIGNDALNLEFQKKAWQAVKNKGNVTGSMKITNLDGSISSIEWRELHRLALDYNVITEGFFAADLGVGTTTGGLLPWLRKGFDPTDTKNFIPYQKGARVGGLVEGQDRLIHFASQVSRGMSYEDAAASAAKHLFDYSDLTAFEQSVMKRIFPYYTWLRKNVPLQLDMMMKYPEKYQYIAKIKLGVEGMVDEDERINKMFVNEFAKDWVQTPLTVTNPQGREEPVLWNPNLPFMDMGRVPDPFNLKRSSQGLFAQTNPIFKTPIEQILNKNFFFDSPVVREGDSQVNKRVDHILSQLAAYNIGKGFMQKRGSDLALHTLNTTSGVKMLSYDYDKYKAMKIQDLVERKRSGEYRNPIDFRAVMRGIKGTMSYASDMVATGVSIGVSMGAHSIADKGMEGMPKRADEYTGALRPISQSKYESLSKEEQMLYTPPDKNTAISYHLTAIELEEKALAETGSLNKLVWVLFDTFNLGKRNQPYMLGQVVNIVDGDTFDINVGGEVKRVRPLLIDTPESTDEWKDNPQPFGREADMFARDFLFDKDVKVIFDGSKQDKYGRVLGYVELTSTGEDFNERMLAEGLATKAFNFEPPYKRFGRYGQAEKSAYDKGKNIWSIDGYSQLGTDSWDNFNMEADAVRRRLEQDMQTKRNIAQEIRR